MLEPYIKSNTKFFVAKVNLAEFEKGGFQYLRPLQMAFESPKFMLPIRLGMANAQQAQDLVVFALARQGKVEVTNYRTVNIPSNMDIPLYVKDVFPDFYKSMFQRAYEKEGMNADLHRVRMEHGLVRSLFCGSADARGIAESGSVLAG